MAKLTPNFGPGPKLGRFGAAKTGGRVGRSLASIVPADTGSVRMVHATKPALTTRLPRVGRIRKGSIGGGVGRVRGRVKARPLSLKRAKTRGFSRP